MTTEHEPAAGFPIPSDEILAIIERAYTDARNQRLLAGYEAPCTGGRMCMARDHHDDCLISIAEMIQRTRTGEMNA